MKFSQFRFSRRLLVATLLALTTVALAAHAALSGGGGTMTVKVTGPMGFSGFDAEGSGLTIKESDGVITAIAPLMNLDTGSKDRDKDFRHHFKVAQHKNAIIKFKRSDLKFPPEGKGKKASGSVNSQLTLAGSTKPLKINYDVVRVPGGYKLDKATFTVNYQKHGIEPPSFLGLSPHNEVEVEVKFPKIAD